MKIESLKKAIRAGRYTVHHSATKRGYIRLDNLYIEEYNGKFGYGYVVHYPSRDKINRAPYWSNSYHKIVYVIKNK